jgi:O-antigen ligase
MGTIIKEYNMKKITLEKFNKNLLLGALFLLLFRVGNFYNSFIPKPFEVFFTLLILSTILYVLWNKKIIDFFLSIPKKYWIAIFLLVFSILFGWGIAEYIKGIPTTFNMVLELGTFSIGLTTLVLILFYSYKDVEYAKKYYYALLIPVVYVFFVLFPAIANHLHLTQSQDSNFMGFTTNVNIVAKIILIPAVYFIAMVLFEKKTPWLKVVYFLIASALTTLLFWTGSRGGILSFFLGSLSVWIILLFHDFGWKKLLLRTGIIVAVFLAGFLMTPHTAKQVAVNRILNPDNKQLSVATIQNKSIFGIVKASFNNQNTSSNSVIIRQDGGVSETRLEIWPFYLKFILKNPFGIGPDTHLASHISNQYGELSSGPHNTYLEIWLWGGLLGLFSFLYLLYAGFKNLKNTLKKNLDPMIVALLATLVTLAIAIIFDDSLSLYYFWAILALSLQTWNTQLSV